MGREVPKLGHGIVEARHVNYDNVAAAGTTDIVNAVNLVNSTHAVTGQPDVPRNVVLTVVDSTSSITAGTVTVYGKNASGDDISEEFDISAGAGTYTGNKPFAYVQSVVGSDIATLGGAGDETLSVGNGGKIGLPMGPAADLLEVYKACVGGADKAIGVVSKTYGTIIPTSSPNGTNGFDFWYLCQIRSGGF